jgi:predicted house-cleaning noncanonical NTP pyrophosphatase (MazG superfamily)
MEVVMSIAKHIGIDLKEIEKERIKKQKSNGGFNKRIFLESVD